MLFDIIEKAGLNGIAAGAVTLPIFGRNATVYVPIANSTVPLSVLSFSLGAAGSVLGDLAHSFINEDVDISEKSKDRASFATGLVINGALFCGLLCAFDSQISDDFGYITAFAVGAGSEFLGSASYTYLKENLYL